MRLECFQLQKKSIEPEVVLPANTMINQYPGSLRMSELWPVPIEVPGGIAPKTIPLVIKFIDQIIFYVFGMKVAKIIEKINAALFTPNNDAEMTTFPKLYTLRIK